MDFKEFFAIAKTFGLDYPSMNYGYRRGGKSMTRDEYEAWKEDHQDAAFLEESWRTGGVTGGSCWDTGDEDHHHGVIGDPEPPMRDLDALLLKVAPNISFLVYRNLENTLLERDSRSKNEYYGNWTEYGIKRINIRKLYDYLVEHGVI